MKTYLFSTLLCTVSLSTVLALNPPLSSRGFQSIFLGSTSDDARYDNRSISTSDYDLRIILMGNIGINTDLWAEFGWNDQTGELAQKRLVSDGIHINLPELEYDWVPLEFRVVGDSSSSSPTALPTSGMGVPVFLGGIMAGPTVKPKLIATPDGKIGMAGANGDFLSRWYACDGTGWGSTLSWSFGEGAPADSKCASLDVFKVNNPRG